MDKVEILKEHQWLQQLVGEWTYESEIQMGPDQPPLKFGGTESVRSIGGIWVVAEGRGEMPNGEPATTMLTVGYDPQKKKFVGTWFGSMMHYLWVYEGSLDAAGHALTLETEGPNCMGGGGMTKFKEVVEVRPDGQRTFSSNMLGEDGNWSRLMNIKYTRVK